jgi:hypothetical protein
MSFQKAITTCQTLALEWTQLAKGDASLPERSLVNGINHQLKFCQERLTKLSAKLEPYPGHDEAERQPDRPQSVLQGEMDIH